MELRKVFAFVITWTISPIAKGSEEDKTCSADEHCDKDFDPRNNFTVDMGNFLTPPDLDVAEIIAEMSSGEEGFVVVRGLFEGEEIEHARKVVEFLIREEAKLDEEDEEEEAKDPNHQSRFRIRIWNLLNKGKIFQKMVQHPLLISIASQTLGEDFQLGTVLSNSILPGGEAQAPHLDYPYWDYFNGRKWPVEPKHEGADYFLSWKATIMLDDFTLENGATAVRPGTQRRAKYPWDHDEFFQHQKQVTGNAGDVMLFFGLLQHCAMPNRSPRSRTGLILQYLPKYVRPMEDLLGSLDEGIVEGASAALRRMLLVDYPYPAVLDRVRQEKGQKPKYDI